MLNALHQFFRSGPRAGPAVPQGTRVYAIGDIHGRRDLLRALSSAVERDDSDRAGADTTVILLGDLIDRGPSSSEVLNAARLWGQRRKVRVLMGNHEEMFLASLDDEKMFRSFMRFGGKETALSYPVDRAAFLAALDEAPGEAMAMMRMAVPERDVAFVRTFEPMIRMGDYLFVHAGIRPGLPLDYQSPVELFWIREPFLSDSTDHGFVVVHGHTITGSADIRPNRIGLDTGAFLTGRLTAMGFEGSERWLIEAREEGGTITTTTEPA